MADSSIVVVAELLLLGDSVREGVGRRNGHVTGTQTRVVAGSSLDETYSGTCSVNSNCTGSFTVLVEPDTRTSTVDLVWTDNTNGASAVFTTPGFILTATAQRISPRETD